MLLTQWPTGNFGYPRGTHGRNGETALAIVDHIMQGTFAGMHSYLADDQKNSYTFGVAKSGRVEQYVALENAAWANGPMREPNVKIDWIRRCFEQGINPNKVTVSIGHEGYSGDTMPEVQIESSIALHRHILVQVPTIKADVSHIVGHYQIDSVFRRYCPGSAFPFARILDALAPETDPWEGVGQGLREWGIARSLRPARLMADWHEWSSFGERCYYLDASGHLWCAEWRKWTGEIQGHRFEVVRP